MLQSMSWSLSSCGCLRKLGREWCWKLWIRLDHRIPSHSVGTFPWEVNFWFTVIGFSQFYLLLFLRLLLCIALASWNSPCWPGWLQSHKDRHISASLLELKECMTTVWLKIWFSKLDLFDSLWCDLGKFCFKCLLWRCSKHVPESPSARHRP